jgi:hypothetical protein
MTTPSHIPAISAGPSISVGAYFPHHPSEACRSDRDFSDALRQHWKTCTARIAAGTEIPRRSLSGKRKQGCDLCTARKRACSTGLPCSECAMRKAECTYHRVRSSTRLRESLNSAGRTPSETTDAESAVQCHGTDSSSGARHCVTSPWPVYLYPWSSLRLPRKLQKGEWVERGLQLHVTIGNFQLIIVAAEGNGWC